MSYVIVVTLTSLGIAGVIFARRNQFNLLLPRSQVLIWVILLIGLAGLVDTAYKDDANRRAGRRVAAVEARLQSLASKPFDLAKPPAAAKFVLETDDGGEPLRIADFAGPFPSYGRKGRLGKLSVALPDIFAVHAEIVIEDDDSVRFTETDANGHAAREGNAGPWFRPDGAQPFVHGADLRPQVSLARILAALKAHGQARLGALEFEIPNNPQTRTHVAVSFERVLAAFKFYARQETPYDPCVSVIVVPMRVEIDPPRSGTRMQLTLRMIEREMLSVECATVPL